jgi:hypothetical protein
MGPTLPNGEPLSIVSGPQGVPIAEGCGVMAISRSTYYAVPQDSTSSALKRESASQRDRERRRRMVSLRLSPRNT